MAEFTNPEIRIWATATDLEGTNQQRKRYYVALEDAGQRRDFELVIGPGNAYAIEPYVPWEYTYTVHDHCDHEGDYCVLEDPESGEYEDARLAEAHSYDVRRKPAEGMAEDWETIEAQAAADLEAVQTDQDAYTFIEKYLSRDLRGRYLAIYRSDRHEMNRSPRQALDSLLSLPPLEGSAYLNLKSVR